MCGSHKHRRVGESHQQFQSNIETVGFSHPTSFPSEWLQVHLGDVVEYGKALKAKADEIEDNTWVLELEDIEKNTSVILQKIIFKERKTKSTKNKFKKGDVLYGKLRPYLNKVVVAEDDGVCSTEILPLSGNIGLNSKYLFYWLKHPTFLEYVTKVGYGVNMPRLGTKDGKQASFIYVPLAKQKEIATQLDNLLAQVDTLKNCLDAISAPLKRFRQSVLAATVNGKIYQHRKADDCKWSKYKIEDCLETVSGVAFKKAQYADNGSRLLQIANVTW
ncbi:MAG TPA: hypothetical protein ENJ51_09115 [Leucothrix mucor]|uniref:Type I restriction modification DNA specificity domain-containing protein n=1 Tax=Leucothrix mucor TaxID=45248 RepID=A0A7V2T1L6_LEUMU|nr:hypothetical protein [Leucothrix mucor]